MADSIYAAASTTPTPSSERIANEFMAQGRPDNPANVDVGVTLGGYGIMTPRVGTGFTEWAVNGYDLEGKHPNPPEHVDYDKHGDWMYDKTILPVVGPQWKEEDNYRPNKETISRGGPQKGK